MTDKEDPQDELRSIAEDGTQEDAVGPVEGGRSSYGPAVSSGGKQEPGGVVPPYDGRRTSADVEDSGGESRPEGAAVGGAAGPRTSDDSLRRPAPADTPGGATTSPADEQPAAETPDGPSAEEGVGPAHVAGTPKGENRGS